VSTPDVGGPLASPGFWLHRAALAYLRVLDAELRVLGLTHTQFSVLAAAGWLGLGSDPPTQQEAAEFAGIDRMMASKVLRVLRAKGLVERVSDRDDARLRRIRCTDDGRQLLRQATHAARAVDDSFFSDVEGDLRVHLAALAGPSRRAPSG
jgi:MarR family transcriptional regulator, organic hydroperoxide resistance regulator